MIVEVADGGGWTVMTVYGGGCILMCIGTIVPGCKCKGPKP